jgi:hypothetical protein
MPKHRRKRAPITTGLFRHSDKQGGTSTGLSKKGIVMAWDKGSSLPTSRKTAIRASDSPRAKNTAEFTLDGLREKGGKGYSKIRQRNRISFSSMFKPGGMEIADKLIAKYGGEDVVLRRWLDGKMGKYMYGPKAVADDIIRNELAFGSFLAEQGRKDLSVRYQGHSWFVEAVFERLTGKKFETTTSRTVKMVRPNEGVSLSHYEDGKVFLNYRGKTYNVTKKFNQIAGRK